MSLDPTIPHAAQAILQDCYDSGSSSLKTIGAAAAAAATVSKGIGPADADTQRVVIEDALRDAMLYANWELIAGNSKEINYFAAGTPPRNPSGNVANIDTVVFKTGATDHLTQTFSYDASDNVILISVA